MEQIGFIGSLDKKDLIVNLGTLITSFGLKVLVIDGTYLQRLRYIIPKADHNNTMTYISEYQGIDIAVGFMNYAGIMQYLGSNNLNYDYILVDSDNIQTMYSFGLQRMKKVFFATSFDKFEVQRAVELFSGLNVPLNLIKIIFSSYINSEEENFLDHALGSQFVSFKQEKIIISDTDMDRVATLENQLAKRVSFKHYSGYYRDGIEYLASMVCEGRLSQQDIKRQIKKI